jgi:hypothetical protein
MFLHSLHHFSNPMSGKIAVGLYKEHRMCQGNGTGQAINMFNEFNAMR